MAILKLSDDDDGDVYLEAEKLAYKQNKDMAVRWVGSDTQVCSMEDVGKYWPEQTHVDVVHPNGDIDFGVKL
jgi:hypothetical protein